MLTLTGSKGATAQACMPGSCRRIHNDDGHHDSSANECNLDILLAGLDSQSCGNSLQMLAPLSVYILTEDESAWDPACGRVLKAHTCSMRQYPDVHAPTLRQL